MYTVLKSRSRTNEKEGGSEGFEVSVDNWWLEGVLKVGLSGDYQTLKRLFGSVCVSVLGGGMFSSDASR